MRFFRGFLCFVFLFYFFCGCESLLGETVWHDCGDLRIGGQGWVESIGSYRRLPDRAEGKVPGSVWGLSGSSSGLVVEFQTDSPSVGIRWVLTSGNLSMPHMPATGVSGVDLYRRNEKGEWFYVFNGRPVARENTLLVNTGNGSGEVCEYKIYLPLYNGIESLAIGVSEGKKFAQRPGGKAKPLVIYGTSITQGACASRPGMAYTAIVERRLGRSVVNLGFSGSGKMEAAVVELIAEIDASVFVIDCLWNLSGEKSEVIEERVINLAQTLRKAHRETPILFVEQSHFKGPWPARTSRAQRKAIDKLKGMGIGNIHVVGGENLIGKDGDGTVDGCHPNDLGMARQAEVLVRYLKTLIVRLL